MPLYFDQVTVTLEEPALPSGLVVVTVSLRDGKTGAMVERGEGLVREGRAVASVVIEVALMTK